MNKLTLAAVLAATLIGGTMTAAAPAQAQGFNFSFNTGDVAFAYSDGYWDRNRNWHSWRSSRELREFRRSHGHLYNNTRHTRVRNQGWRDQDGDGIPNRVDRDKDGDGVPNRFDNRPNSPNSGTRRDADGDGVPNRYDSRPNNPYRP